MQILTTIYILHGFIDAWNSPTGREILAEDATLKIWKPGIYERKQRFIRWISYLDLVAGTF